jgi:16S rRNA (guanine527-N7)-methyltransferase
MENESLRILWRSQLQRGLDVMGIGLESKQLRQMTDYLALLLKWNQAFNLTAVREPREMVPRQLLDSLSVLHLLQGSHILDVGTGPGLPGIPLAISRPGLNFTLLDSNGKKTRFVHQAKTELLLQNVEVVHGRVEEYGPALPFDTIVSRAFAPLQKMISLATHLMSEQVLFLAMKGALPVSEIQEAEQRGCNVEIIPLWVPQTSAKRHALLCRTDSANPDR